MATTAFLRISICSWTSSQNTPRWVRALSNLPDGTAKELEGNDALFESEGEYASRINDEFTVDIMPSACGHHWHELSQHIVHIEIDDVSVPVLFAGRATPHEGGPTRQGQG